MTRRIVHALIAAAFTVAASPSPAQPRLASQALLAPEPPASVPKEQRELFGVAEAALADIHPNPGQEICFLWPIGAVQVFGLDAASLRAGAPRFVELGFHQFGDGESGPVRVDFARFADFNDGLAAIATLDQHGCVAWGELGQTGFAASRFLTGVPPWPGADDGRTRSFDQFGWLDFAQDMTGDGLGDIFAMGPNKRPVAMIQQADGSFVSLDFPALPDRANVTARFAVYPPKRIGDWEEPAVESTEEVPAAPKGGRLDLSAGSWLGPLAFEDFDGDGYPDLLALLRDDGERSTTLVPGTPDPIARLWRGKPDPAHPSGWSYAEPPLELCGVAGAGDPGSMLMDLNDDGVVDRLSLFSNYDVAAPRTRLTFYDGAKQPRDTAPDGAERLVYKIPATVIRSRDPVGMSMLADFNRDGRRDAALTHFTYLFGSVSEMADSYLNEMAEFAVRFHLTGETGLEQEPSATLRVACAMEVFGPGRGSVHPLIVGGDYDGDGHEDFALRTKLREIAVYGLPPRQGENSRPSATIEWEREEGLGAIEPVDLDADGRDELLLVSGGWVIACFFN